jgi:hypothetical protein
MFVPPSAIGKNMIFWRKMLKIYCIYKVAGKKSRRALLNLTTGADPGFQVRGDTLKKKCAERREARKFLGYFV